jgi:hypothetical protein
MTLARRLAWVALGWAVVSTMLCFYWGIAWGAPFIALSGPIGLIVVSILVWTLYRHWILISIPLAIITIPISGAGLNPAFVFALSCVLILVASLIDIFEVQDAKFRATRGNHA